VLQDSEAILSKVQRLVGIDGKAKASKSMDNAIFLSDSSEVIKQKIQAMYTDPNHIKASDPGKTEGNAVFAYLDAFYEDSEELEDLKNQYRKGGLGDSVVKEILNDTLQSLLKPIRERRAEVTDAEVENILLSGSEKARKVADSTLMEVRNAIGLKIALK
jgi:tryptophanyl-tRNA synthetase